MGYFSSTTNRNKQSQQFPQYGFQSVCMGNFLITFPPCMGALLKIQNRHLTITRFQIRLMFCCSSIENVFTLCFSNSTKKRNTNAQVHSYTFIHALHCNWECFVYVRFFRSLSHFFSLECCVVIIHIQAHIHIYTAVHIRSIEAVTMSASDKKVPKAMHLVHRRLLFLFVFVFEWLIVKLNERVKREERKKHTHTSCEERKKKWTNERTKKKHQPTTHVTNNEHWKELKSTVRSYNGILLNFTKPKMLQAIVDLPPFESRDLISSVPIVYSFSFDFSFSERTTT